MRRPLVSATVIALSATMATLVLAGSCQNPPMETLEGLAIGSIVAGSGSSMSFDGSGGPIGVVGPTNTNGPSSTNSVASPGPVPPGGPPGNGGTSSPSPTNTNGPSGNGGTSNPGPVNTGNQPSNGGSTASNGGTGNQSEPCVDVEPPPDPEWPDATCESWATETDECSAAWFAEYCDVSCGRCTPEGGDTGSGGMPAEEEPCVDVEPPPNDEWPDATCESWATETEECSADWFAEYCDVSCGRCVPEGGDTGSGGMPAEEEPCEDVEPPEDPEWPGATCSEWATETDECNAAWFSNYCDISCGRCVPEGGLPPEPMGVDCSGEGLPNVTGGEGFATRYWDCCQPHCAQFDGHKCSQDGTSRTGDQTSSCNGGGSFACYDEAPRAVSDCLSYGHIAKSNPNCGGCYRIQFTGQGEHNANDPGSKLIAGKQMIVKVTNTGGDVAGNQFDLMIPGGGVGQFNACSRQWGTNDLGAQYGGFLSECSGSHAEKKECVRQGCMRIPEGGARDGCLWFVDWFEVADNPKFTSQPTDCPF